MRVAGVLASLGERIMQTIHVIGVGMNPSDLGAHPSGLISAAEVLVGGERLLTRFQDFPGTRIVIKSPLEKVFAGIRAEAIAGRRVVVLADGDPGFFGIGKKLVEEFGKERVEIYPNSTAMQHAAARLKIPWENIQSVSLHGRKDMNPLLRAITKHERVGVYTDALYGPGRIAEELMRIDQDAFQMHVFEDLGGEGERMGSYRLEEARGRAFSSLNFVLLERIRGPEIVPRLGLEDERYLHEAGLITKREIRAVGLAMLQLGPSHTVWDLGAGCGSVGIEASLLAHEGATFCVEKDAGRVEMLRENVRRMGAYGVQVVHGEMPGCLRALPEPDRIFLGGGLGGGLEVLREACLRLKPGGKVVLHLVLLRSLDRVRGFLTEAGWDYDLTQVQVCRSRKLAGDERLEALNPVYMISAEKPI